MDGATNIVCVTDVELFVFCCCTLYYKHVFFHVICIFIYLLNYLLT